MIEKIYVKNVASYDEQGAVIDQLKKVNFFFGANGSGKTTISRVIEHDGDETYPDCCINWAQEKKLERLVYNQDFVKENFRPHEDLKGIFTLGKAEAGVQEKLEVAQKSLTAIKDQLGLLGGGEKEQEAQLNQCERSFEAECWNKLKEKYEAEFGELIADVVFVSLNKSKKKFAERILAEYEKYKTPFNAEIEQLKQQAQTAFDDTAEPENNIEILDRDTIRGLAEIVSSPILKKEIIGKQNSSFGELIQKLGNSDWVHEGLDYIHEDGDPCPFCQQKVESDILTRIQNLFDEQYNKDIAFLEGIRVKYDGLRESILNSFNMAQIAPEQFLDRETFDRIKNQLEAILDKNQLVLKTKIDTPSRAAQLADISSIVAEAQDFLKSINDKIARYNDAIKNRSQRREHLKQSFWSYIIHENDVFIETYLKQKVALEGKLAQFTKEINSLSDKNLGLEREIKALQDSLSGVDETANSINNILKRYGFRNFSLVTCGAKKEFYKLIRSDGAEAKETLSEGEFSFITFLYFYYLVQSKIKDSAVLSMVIVFDDPVSSLDSSVLFIVSELIRSIIETVRAKGKSEKQIFIFTHNIYFHKQVTNEQEGDRAYYIVRKDISKTVIIPNGDKNPVENSYQILWSELKALKEHRDTASVLMVQNIMRRIIEYYFRFLGGKEPKALTRKLKETNKKIGLSLVAYMHSGSHNIADEICYSPDADIDTYLDAFKEIFEANDQLNHYNMMWQGGHDRLMIRSKE